MSKILIWADAHIHPFRPYSTILENGLNSRLADAVNCISQIKIIVEQQDIDLILFSGDLLHQRKQVATSTFNASYRAIEDLASTEVPLILIPGNHDQSSQDGGEYSIYAFNRISRVVGDVCWDIVRGKSGSAYNLFFVPYREKIDLIKNVLTKKPNNKYHTLFLGHLGINGAQLGSDFVYSSPYDAKIEELSPHLFQAGFLGHFHTYQSLGFNFWYCGSPLPFTWSDVDQPRGCIIYDTDTKQHRHIVLKSPQFVLLDEVGIEKVNIPTDSYIRIKSKIDWSDDRKEAFRKLTSARSVEVITESKAITENAVRMLVRPDMSFSDLLDVFLQSGIVKDSSLDMDYLSQVGKEVLESITENL